MVVSFHRLVFTHRGTRCWAVALTWDDNKNIHGRNLVNTTSLASFTELFGTFYNFVDTLKKEPGVLGKSITNRTWSFGEITLGDVEEWGGFIAVGGVKECWQWWWWQKVGYWALFALNWWQSENHQQPRWDKSRERGGEMREGGEPKHEVASSVEGQPQGERRNQNGMRTWSQALRALRGEVQGDG